jgi:hypothetical protein
MVLIGLWLAVAGVARGQLLAQQLAIGAGYGVFGAVVGVPLGLLLARVLVWIFSVGCDPTVEGATGR